MFPLHSPHLFTHFLSFPHPTNFLFPSFLSSFTCPSFLSYLLPFSLTSELSLRLLCHHLPKAASCPFSFLPFFLCTINVLPAFPIYFVFLHSCFFFPVFFFILPFFSLNVIFFLIIIMYLYFRVCFLLSSTLSFVSFFFSSMSTSLSTLRPTVLSLYLSCSLVSIFVF